VWNYVFMADRPTFSRYSNYLYMPSMVQVERLGGWVDAVADAGTSQTATVGLVRYDEPIQKHLADDVLKPRMAAHGVRVTDEAAFRPATGAASAADLSAAGQQHDPAVPFENVNRVVLQPTAAVLPLLFFTAAQAPELPSPLHVHLVRRVVVQTQNNGASQLAGSMVYGWLLPKTWPSSRTRVSIQRPSAVSTSRPIADRRATVRSAVTATACSS